MDYKNNLIHVGLTIRKYRIAHGYSQEDLSALIQCDKNTIGNIERGTTDSSVSYIFKICDVLNISFVQFAKEVEYASQNEYAATNERAILRLFHYCQQLNSEHISTLNHIASQYIKEIKRKKN